MSIPKNASVNERMFFIHADIVVVILNMEGQAGSISVAACRAQFVQSSYA